MKASSSVSYFQYWGKLTKEQEGIPRRAHLLPYHCLDVAAVGKVLMERNPRLIERVSAGLGLERDDTRALLLSFLAFHDVGKFSESFQNLCPEILSRLQGRTSSRGYPHRHDELGLAWWNQLRWDSETLLKAFDVDDGARCRLGNYLEPIAQTVFGHHGFPVNAGGIDIKEHFGERDFHAAAQFARDVVNMFARGPFCLPPDLRGLYQRLRVQSWLLAGFVVVCDWIGSNRDFFPLQDMEQPLNEYWTVACRQAAEAVNAAGILPERAAPFHSMAALFPTLGEVEPSPLQAFVTDCALPSGPQLWIIEDITGSGKTEAALILAHRLMQKDADGFFVALPTMATANAMYDRVAAAYRNFFSPDAHPSLVLAHGKRRLMGGFSSSILEMPSSMWERFGTEDNEAAAECAQWIADNRKKAFLAHAGVGTMTWGRRSLRLPAPRPRGCGDHRSGLVGRTAVKIPRAEALWARDQGTHSR